MQTAFHIFIINSVTSYIISKSCKTVQWFLKFYWDVVGVKAQQLCCFCIFIVLWGSWSEWCVSLSLLALALLRSFWDLWFFSQLVMRLWCAAARESGAECTSQASLGLHLKYFKNPFANFFFVRLHCYIYQCYRLVNCFPWAAFSKALWVRKSWLLSHILLYTFSPWAHVSHIEGFSKIRKGHKCVVRQSDIKVIMK